MKVMTTAGYAAFGSDVFQPFVDGATFGVVNYGMLVFGWVALGLSVWYAVPSESE